MLHVARALNVAGAVMQRSVWEVDPSPSSRRVAEGQDPRPRGTTRRTPQRAPRCPRRPHDDRALQRAREGAPRLESGWLQGTREDLDEAERTIHEQGLVGVLRELHDDLDAAVADAYAA